MKTFQMIYFVFMLPSLPQPTDSCSVSPSFHRVATTRCPSSNNAIMAVEGRAVAAKVEERIRVGRGETTKERLKRVGNYEIIIRTSGAESMFC